MQQSNNSADLAATCTIKESKPPIWYAAGRIKRYERLRFGMIEYALEPEQLFGKSVAPIIAGDGFDYSGPFTMSCDHSCSHAGEWSGWVKQSPDDHYDDTQELAGTGTHGSAVSGCIDDLLPSEASNQKRHVYLRALDGIATADAVFVWIDDHECYGTLLEIGYAKALGKPIFLAHPNHIRPTGELWFAFESATYTLCADDPAKAFALAVRTFPITVGRVGLKEWGATA